MGQLWAENLRKIKKMKDGRKEEKEGSRGKEIRYKKALCGASQHMIQWACRNYTMKSIRRGNLR